MKGTIFLSVVLLSSFLFAQDTHQDFSWTEKSSISAHVDYLYWQVAEGGLDYIYTDAITSGTFYGGRGDIHRATFNWHSGFRVALDYSFAPDFWKIRGQYGNFVPSGREKMTPLTGQTIQGTFPNVTTTTLAHATSAISLRMHFADLLLSKSMQISKNVLFEFINGLSGVWFKQNWEVTYEGTQPGGLRESIKPKWRFKGVGMKAGANVDWQLPWGLSWNALTSIAGIFGNYDNRMILFTTNISTEVRDVLQNTHYDDFRIVPILQLSMGPAWQKAFRSWGIRLSASYEMNIFTNVNQFDRDEFYNTLNNNPQSRVKNAQLQMHGVCATLLISF